MLGNITRTLQEVQSEKSEQQLEVWVVILYYTAFLEFILFNT